MYFGDMFRSTVAIIAIFVVDSGLAQLSHGGQPWQWGSPLHEQPVHTVGLGPIEAPAPRRSGPAFRYGQQRSLPLDVLATGTWDMLPDGRERCRVVVRSDGAAMLSAQFDRFRPADGAQVFLHDADRRHFLGAFVAANAVGGELATAVLPGASMAIEYIRPAGATGDQLHLASITHAFLDLFDRSDGARDINPGYQSAPCHTNVICPAASGWQQQKRSSAMFLRPDGGGCTGTILNNTAQNGVPYFLTAKHCYQPNEGQWVFYFNYESPNCVGDTGQTMQTLSGSALAASNDGGDLLLLRLNDTPPAAYDVFYAGWDRSNTAPSSGSMIHHPLNDVKKINLFSLPGTSVVHSSGIPCWSVNWANGVAEGGSSGAGLFNSAKRVVGTAYDGEQTCTTSTTAPSFFAKLSANWDGASSDRRLRDWLDPANTTAAINGYDPVGTPGPVLGLSVSIRAMLQGAFLQQTGNMRTSLRDQGLIPLQEPYTLLGYPHQGGGGETTTPAVLAVTGQQAIVDWVVVELRPASAPATVAYSRSALIRSDGMVVGTDGTSAVTFPTAAWGNYHIALRHRNHLGVMTARAQVLGGVLRSCNFMNGSVALHGAEAATVLLGGIQCLPAGDATWNGRLRYMGAGNDRDPILTRVGGSTPTATALGYFREDTDLNGVVRYTGSGNDRDIVLQNIGGSVPTVVRTHQLPE